MSIAGIPWWTTDIGGFHGGNQNDPDYVELLIRWFQFAAFCPVCRLHGCRENGEPSRLAEKAPTGGPNEIWSYGEEAYLILKEYIALREKMRPYVKTTMRKTAETGIPPMRPLWFDYPSDDSAWDIEDEYMFGDQLLIAPVMEPGLRKRSVYLPRSSAWKNHFDQEIYEGGQTVTVDTPLSVIPCFIKQDALTDPLNPA